MKTTNRIQTLSLLLVMFFGMAAGAFAQTSNNQKDVKKVLCIGNSFTYFFDSDKRLAELAESQGHQLDVNAQTSGGYSFHRHLNRDETSSAIIYGRYDYVFLQDQSKTAAIYAQNPKRGKLLADDTKELADRIHIYSPNAKIWLEHTWAFPAANYGGFGSYEEFDRLMDKGVKMLAKKAGTEISPIGKAFALCRAERPDINLYSPDNHHPSELGTYLKSCVNYLMIFGEPFTAEATDCGNDPEIAAYLRGVAERTVGLK